MDCTRPGRGSWARWPGTNEGTIRRVFVSGTVSVSSNSGLAGGLVGGNGIDGTTRSFTGTVEQIVSAVAVRVTGLRKYPSAGGLVGTSSGR